MRTFIWNILSAQKHTKYYNTMVFAAPVCQTRFNANDGYWLKCLLFIKCLQMATILSVSAWITTKKKFCTTHIFYSCCSNLNHWWSGPDYDYKRFHKFFFIAVLQIFALALIFIAVKYIFDALLIFLTIRFCWKR